MDVFNELFKIKEYKNIGLVNMTSEFFALYTSFLFRKIDRGVLIVTPTLFEADKIHKDLLNYEMALFFPADDFLTTEVLAASPELKAERLNTINNLVDNSKKIVVTDLNGYLQYLPKVNIFKEKILQINLRTKIDTHVLSEKLFSLGYNKESLVAKTGDYAVRGFVIDIFPIKFENPIRIEFFGDQIESIRYFDVESQKTISIIDEIVINPYTEFLMDGYTEEVPLKPKNLKNCGEVTNILDYLDNPIVIFKDYNQIKIMNERINNEILEFKNEMFDIEEYMFNFNKIKIKEYIYYYDFDSYLLDTDLKLNSIKDFNVKSVEKLNEDIDKINMYLKKNIELGKTIILSLSEINVKKFIEQLTVSYLLTDEKYIYDNCLNIISKKMNKGFEIENYIFLTEFELFNRKKENLKYRYNLKFSTRIKDLSKITIGDYIVHNLHGIGIYNGLKTLEKNGYKSDYLEILYAKEDKIYIPASKIDMISKYSGKEGYLPKINSLNSNLWLKTKQKIKEKLKYEAGRLLKVQAERDLLKGFAYSEDTPMQDVFESQFIYEMTPDQISVTEEIKKDMENIKPMDRILCGDVGYGKTEVAFRAMFKSVMDSKQVFYLCPTTLLSKQQYESAKERFKNFPVNIELINRFTSHKKVKEILKNIEKGSIDILFGTHRLLSKDLKPKDLGLLIVDEEQRFGVAHKEKIKEYKSNIDVLTLTATPIPRTLQMAMLGLRNLSLIETPPKNRYSIQTYVLEENNCVLRDVIYKELSRNGQVFILYNKVINIEKKVEDIKKIIPDARITFAHGQMNKEELEERMNNFVNLEYDILICTTIIETGIDIPNVNTLIIFDADKFGLSQLYQIRGRIGRSDRIGYAYLFYDRNKVLTETSVKRLKVIKEFTELGSGFKIASRDLAIRGAGDILGKDQAGYMDAVGIDLYLELLNNEMLKLKGIEIEEDEDEDEVSIINISNHIKDEYLKDNDIKIEIHKLINEIDSFEKFDNIKKEVEDRFGKVDKDLNLYMNGELFEKFVKKTGVDKVVDNIRYLEISFTKEKSNSINYEELFIKSLKITNEFKFNYKNERLFIKINKHGGKEHPIIYFNQLFKYL